MGSPSYPDPPDPQETANAATGQNVTTAIANTQLGQVNQITPNGSLTYNQIGQKTVTDPNSGQSYEIPQYQATTRVTPAAQKTIDTNATTNRVMSDIGLDRAVQMQKYLSQSIDPNELTAYRNLPGTPQLANYQGNAGLDTRGAVTGQLSGNVNAPDVAQGFVRRGDIQNSYTDGSAMEGRNRVEEALMARMQPQIDRDREQQRAQLANQGIGLGSEAFSDAQFDQDRSINDARLGAILSAGQEQSRIEGLQQNRATFANNAQAQDYTQALQNVGQFNAAQGQIFDQRMQNAGLNNSMQAQRFSRDAANIQMQNAARQQALDNRNSQISGYNQNQQANFANQNSVADSARQRRQQQLEEQFALRNQPINEITALLSGSQVSSPNFNVAQPSQIANTDVAGIINENYNQRMNKAQAEYQAQQSLFGGVLGLGSSLLF